jgi:hypothetical protein
LSPAREHATSGVEETLGSPKQETVKLEANWRELCVRNKFVLRWPSVRLRRKFVAGTPNLNYPFILNLQCFSVLGYRQHFAVEAVTRTDRHEVT